MSKVKISENLFLEAQEIKRRNKFQGEDGYKQFFISNHSRSGLLLDRKRDPDFNYFKLSPGTTPVKASLNSGYAADTDGNLIVNGENRIDYIDVLGDNIVRYVILSYDKTTLEVGVSSISATGQLSGVGTLFTEVLRGQPNVPSRVKFYKEDGTTPVNNGEYEVLSVNSDTDVIVFSASPFVVESDLKIAVIGTFTPGFVVPPSSKEIFEYDHFLLSQRTAFTWNPDTEIFLGSVQSDGVSLSVIDSRHPLWKGIYKSVALEELTKNPFEDNPSHPLIGLESARFDTLTSDKSKTLFKFGWGFRVPVLGLSFDFTDNSATITAGNGGKYTDPTFFSSGEFDDWILYSEMGIKYNIKTSIKVGSDIKLFLYETVGATTGPHNSKYQVVPNADKVIFRFSPTLTGSNHYSEVTFPIFLGVGECRAPNGVGHKIEYSLGFAKQWTRFLAINDGPYLDPASFDVNGIQTGNLFGNMLNGIGSFLSDPSSLFNSVNSLNIFVNDPWIVYIPNLTAKGSMTATAVISFGKYKVVGKTLHLSIRCNAILGGVLNDEWYMGLPPGITSVPGLTENASFTMQEFGGSHEMARIFNPVSSPSVIGVERVDNGNYTSGAHDISFVVTIEIQ